MITNVALTKEGEEYYWGFHSDDEVNELHFLKNVRYCPDAGSFDSYRIYGEPIGMDDFKLEVAEYLKTNADKYDHVLYNLHGFNVDPEGSFEGAEDFLSQHDDSKYLVIPINWRNYWGFQFPSYEVDRNGLAPSMGKLLAQNVDVFKSDYEASIMCHSMGNYVFRVFAQNIEEPELLFSNMFSVAADARMDMFSTDFNPDAPTDTTFHDHHVEGFSDVLSEAREQVELQIPDDELRPNGGYAITLIAKAVHVIWNRGDHALAIRETFQIGWGEGMRKAIGKYGDEAEQLTTLKYFKERVHYHDFSQIVEFIGLEHSYQWLCPVVNIYKQYKECEHNCPEPEPCPPSSITKGMGEGMLLRGAGEAA